MGPYAGVNSSIERGAKRTVEHGFTGMPFRGSRTPNDEWLKEARDPHTPSKPKSAVRHYQVCLESLITWYGMWSFEGSIENRDGISDSDEIQTTDKSTSVVQQPGS